MTESSIYPKKLATRLRLLLDYGQAIGSPFTDFDPIAAELSRRGINLSRARWSYMKSGNTSRLVTDTRLLMTIADMFGVDRMFLLDLDTDQMPEPIRINMEYIDQLRAARVAEFAARTYGAVNSDILDGVRRYVEQAEENKTQE